MSVLSDTVREQLRERIIEGVLTPGSQIAEEYWAVELSVSRTPVREAVRQLSEEGFVVCEPHRSARVADLTPVFAIEVLQIREALEGMAVREATPRMEPAVIKQLRAEFEALRVRIAQGDLADVGDRIHGAILSACGNKRLERLMAVYRNHVTWIQQTCATIPGRLPRSFREHESILCAIESRDGEFAEAAMRSHLRNNMSELIHYLGTSDTNTPASENGSR